MNKKPNKSEKSLKYINYSMLSVERREISSAKSSLRSKVGECFMQKVYFLSEPREELIYEMIALSNQCSVLAKMLLKSASAEASLDQELEALKEKAEQIIDASILNLREIQTYLSSEEYKSLLEKFCDYSNYHPISSANTSDIIKFLWKYSAVLLQTSRLSRLKA